MLSQINNCLIRQKINLHNQIRSKRIRNNTYSFIQQDQNKKKIQTIWNLVIYGKYDVSYSLLVQKLPAFISDAQTITIFIKSIKILKENINRRAVFQIINECLLRQVNFSFKQIKQIISQVYKYQADFIIFQQILQKHFRKGQKSLKKIVLKQQINSYMKSINHNFKIEIENLTHNQRIKILFNLQFFTEPIQLFTIFYHCVSQQKDYSKLLIGSLSNFIGYIKFQIFNGFKSYQLLNQIQATQCIIVTKKLFELHSLRPIQFVNEFKQFFSLKYEILNQIIYFKNPEANPYNVPQTINLGQHLSLIQFICRCLIANQFDQQQKQFFIEMLEIMCYQSWQMQIYFLDKGIMSWIVNNILVSVYIQNKMLRLLGSIIQKNKITIIYLQEYLENKEKYEVFVNRLSKSISSPELHLSILVSFFEFRRLQQEQKSKYVKKYILDYNDKWKLHKKVDLSFEFIVIVIRTLQKKTKIRLINYLFFFIHVLMISNQFDLVLIKSDQWNKISDFNLKNALNLMIKEWRNYYQYYYQESKLIQIQTNLSLCELKQIVDLLQYKLSF